MAVISNLSVSLTANTKGLTRGLNRAKKQVRNFTKSVFNIKSAIVGALGIGSIGAVVSSSLSAWRTQEMAVTSLESSISSMGRTTAGLSGNLQKLAVQIQGEGIIGDEAIIQGQSFLTTYSQISDKLLPRATRVMADLTAKTGATTQAIANLIGKAAMGDVGALKRYGITMSEASLKTKDFELILNDIEQQVGGTNKAMGDTASGGIIQFSNAFGDVKEKIGQVVSIAISPWMRQLSKELGNTSIESKSMGESFKNSLVNGIKAAAPFLNVLNGIHLVIKTLKLGFMGFGLLVTDIVSGVSGDLNRLFSAFGSDAFKGIAGFSDESFKSQLANISILKKEIRSLSNDVSNKTAGKSLINKANDFDQKAQISEMKKRLNLPDTGGNFRKKQENPQINKTNDLLIKINNHLSKPVFAAAG